MKTFSKTAIAAIALGSSLALTGCVPGFVGMGPGSGPQPYQDGGQDSVDANSVDTMFTMMMIPHHEQAIEMVDVLLEKDGIDEDVIALAQRIKAAQGPEIDLMESWLEEWGLPSSSGMGGMDHGNGMMSESDMQELEDASGHEASVVFLEQMIEHHEGAIDMSQPVIDRGQDADVVSLATRIVESQSAEIVEMRELLASL